MLGASICALDASVWSLQPFGGILTCFDSFAGLTTSMSMLGASACPFDVSGVFPLVFGSSEHCHAASAGEFGGFDSF